MILVLRKLDCRGADSDKQDNTGSGELNPSKGLLKDKAVADEGIEYADVTDEGDEA